MTESQASLPLHLAEGSENMQKVDPPSGSTQANESFHAVKAKYTDKRLNFTISTEARFALVQCPSRFPGRIVPRLGKDVRLDRSRNRDGSPTKQNFITDNQIFYLIRAMQPSRL
jgi:hypothetical protein